MAVSKARVAFQLEPLGMGRASKALDSVNNRFKRIEKRLEKVNKRYEKQNTVLSRLNQKFNKAGIVAAKAGQKFAKVGMRDLRRYRLGIHRVNKKLLEMQRRYRDVEQRLKPMLSGFDKIGKKARNAGLAMTIGLTAPIGAFGASAISASADFESGMNRVQVLTKGVSFEQLEKEALRLGSATAYSATEAADAMGFLAMAGFQSDQILGSMESTLNLASAGQMDLAASADIVSNVMTGYGISIDKITDSADALVGTFASSNTSLMQLGESLKVAGPIAASVNIPFNETLSLIGAMGNAGFQGERAGTALAGGLGRLIKPVKAVNDALRDLKIDPKSLKDSEGNLNSLTEILELLEKRGAKTDDFLRIFGQEAGKAFVALKKQGTASIRELEKKIAASGGRAKEIADAMNKGANGAIKSVKSAMEGLQIAIAKSGLLDWFTKITQGVANFLRKMSKLNPVLLKYGTIIAIVVAAIGPMLLIFGQAVLIVSKMIFVFTFLGPVIMSAASAMAIFAIKAILIVGAIAAVVYAGWFLWKNWAKIIDWMIGLWDRYRDSIKTILILLGPAGLIIRGFWELYEHWREIVNGMIKMWNRLVDKLGEWGRKKLGLGKIDLIAEAKLEGEDKLELGPIKAPVDPGISYADSIIQKAAPLGPVIDAEPKYDFNLTPTIIFPEQPKSDEFDLNPIPGITGEIGSIFDAFANPFVEDSAPDMDLAKIEVPTVPEPEPVKKMAKIAETKPEKAVAAASVMPMTFDAPQGVIGQRDDDGFSLPNLSGLFSGGGSVLDDISGVFSGVASSLGSFLGGEGDAPKTEKVAAKEDSPSFLDRVNNLMFGESKDGEPKVANRFERFEESRFTRQEVEKKEQVEIVVDFKNMPKNTKIDLKNPSKIPVRVNRGLALDREIG